MIFVGEDKKSCLSEINYLLELSTDLCRIY